MKNFSICLFFTLIAFASKAQSFIGLETDSYSGNYGLIFNPAKLADSKYRVDISLFSISALATNDYFGIDLNTALSGEGDFDFEDDGSQDATNDNNFALAIDVLGPSFSFNINEVNSVALVTRVRGHLGVFNINGELFESFNDSFDTNEDFNFEVNNLNTTSHSWAEVGVAYARVLLDQDTSFLKGGVTLKYLLGAGVAFGNSNAFTGSYDASNETLTTQGSLTYGSTLISEGDDDEFTFDDTTAGLGFDFGLEYEWRSDDADGDYKIKAGFAITDIGSVTYDDVEVTNYDLNATVDFSDYDGEVFDFIDENYTSTVTNREVKASLPTALRLYGDYSFNEKFYAGISTSFALTSKDEEANTSHVGYYSIIPRYESKWFSAYSPIGVNSFGAFNWGAGFRLGPLTIGSGSIISSLVSSNSKIVDLYAGLRVPLYR